jgi:hypothetical protein
MRQADPPRLRDDVRTRLARLLGSEHDGEALNAARLADKLVRSEGVTWHQVLAVPSASPTDAPRPSAGDDPLRQFATPDDACEFVLSSEGSSAHLR